MKPAGLPWALALKTAGLGTGDVADLFSFIEDDKWGYG
jgi:hypothetical protein